MAAIIIYFTQNGKNCALYGDKVYEEGQLIDVLPAVIEKLAKRQYVSPWVKYYSDSTYTVENPYMEMLCSCTPRQLLHGNPNCPEHH